MTEITVVGVKTFLVAAQHFFAAVGLLAVNTHEKLVLWAKEEDRLYERRVVLEALQRRRQWKVSDAQYLRTLPRARIAPRRLTLLEASGLRGRPTVKPYAPLPHMLIHWGKNMRALVDAATLPHDRLKVMKRTKLWPEFAEALYRGCYAEAKIENISSPSAAAENQAAELLVISPALLRHMHTGVRRNRRVEDRSEPIIQALSQATFLHWKHTGQLPE